MKRRNILLTVTAGLLIVLTGMPAADDTNTGIISGRVCDAANGHGVSGAWVALAENNQGVHTDSLGCFRMDQVPAGTYSLIVSHADFVTASGRAELTVKVAAGRESSVRIELTRVREAKGDSVSRVEMGKQGLDLTAMGQASLMEVSRTPRDNKGTDSRDKCRPESPARDNESAIDHSSGGVCKHVAPTCMPRAFEPYGPADMFFRDYGTNGFVETRRDRFSTFAVDVDDASYTLVRRYLKEGNVPPQDAVRVEEFINHFDYGYKNPNDSRFRVFSELTDSPFDDNVSILKIGIKGKEAAACRRKPINLTLVVDVSGSMGYDNRMRLVKQSLRLLIDQLDANDKVGIVSYNTSARTILTPVAGDARGDIVEAIERLSPGGSTNAEAGLTLGYQMAGKQYVSGHNNIVVLCSDGVANVGETGSDGIMARIRRLVDQGITLSTFGFGMGNYNDVLLEQLAQSGNGRYAYINDLEEARRAFVEDFVANTQVLARDVKIQVEFDAQAVRSYRLVGYENRAVADHRFRDDNQDGGEVGMGHEVTAIYELVLVARRQTDRLATVFVRCKDADQIDVVEHSYEVLRGRDYQTFDRSRPELRLAIAACRFAELLKGSVDGGSDQYDRLYRIAERVNSELRTEQTAELTDLIRLAGNMTSPHTYWYDREDDGYVNYKR